MSPEHVATFVEEFTREWNRLQAEHGTARHGFERELRSVERKLGRLVDAIAPVMRGFAIQQQLDGLEARRTVLQHDLQLTETSIRAPALHPNLAAVYRDRLAALQNSLGRGAETETISAARASIERVILHPTATKCGLKSRLSVSWRRWFAWAQMATAPVRGRLTVCSIVR